MLRWVAWPKVHVIDLIDREMMAVVVVNRSVLDLIVGRVHCGVVMTTLKTKHRALNFSFDLFPVVLCENLKVIVEVGNNLTG